MTFKNTISIIFVVLFQFSLFGQGTPSFTVSTDAKQVLENSYFEITFSINNGQGANFQPPSFNNFKIISGPSRSMETTIINGAMTRKESFSFTLLPKKTGKLIISSAQVLIKGKVYKTKPVRIEVLKASSKQLQSGEDIFLRLFPSDSVAVVGQKINIYYKIYTRKNISNFGLKSEPEYTGFFSEEERNTDYRTVQEIINGQQYTTKVMKTMAIYPQKAGNLTIEPLLAEVAISDGKRQSSFFNRGRRISLRSLPLTINVSSLPEGAPMSFSGAVGNFKMVASSGRNRLSTDEAINIKMRLSGVGDMKRVQVVEFPVPESFERYDPSITDVEQKTFNRINVVGKEIDYIFVPQKPGTFRVQPQFSFFNPDSMAYITLKGQTYTYTVTQGKIKPKINLALENEGKNTVLAPIQSTTKLKVGSAPFIFSKVYPFLFGLPLLALFGGIWVNQKRNDVEDISEEEKKRRKARKIALERLGKAKSYLNNPSESKSFYDEISKALLGFVCSKLNIPFSALKKTELLDKLKELNIPEALTNDFTDVLKNSEMALYAARNNEAAMQESFDKAENVLTNMEVFLIQ